MPPPPNVLAERLSATLARLGFVVSQIRAIEVARQKRLEQETETRPHARFGCWLGLSASVLNGRYARP